MRGPITSRDHLQGIRAIEKADWGEILKLPCQDRCRCAMGHV